ncbi:MAG: bifunctional phosphopantothenoylcysteine decarboxylase/phosphopantothenate--cysteine ligase CoaBC [Bacteroidetes bacterium]|nr:bifunctional phosphopantothenoylcysteine decarboxylase/phosphopantothenate--cysteine ligase CoaBC [Bacteroidota bacterium]MBU1719574.1 bifunctional phosphopantothenoylcysteine decarboxylase/phosphopantothenate--cysteine ligase CoaBC [Bacteroidota bacterium]
MLQGKKVILGISGGIAAYKSPLILRLLQQQGAEVRVVATKNALEFTTVATLETLSGYAVYTDMFEPGKERTTEHISLSDWADLMVVAPATANIIGKLASGIADDELSTVLLAFNGPLFIAPAMNEKMWLHFSVKKNVAYLAQNGVKFIGPNCGDLACGWKGAGRMSEPDQIVAALSSGTKKKNFKGKKILVTAGPTFEPIDPVRFIGNHSSGKMGFAIADEFANQGGIVTLISGPVSIQPENQTIRKISVHTAAEMHSACQSHAPKADIIVMTAAVADYRVKNVAGSKIKKSENSLLLNLVPTEDILAGLGKRKKKNQILVGFALETDNGLENATQKLMRKNADIIILNSMKDAGAGFGHDTNKITIIDKYNKITNFGLNTKKQLAADIAAYIFRFKA